MKVIFLGGSLDLGSPMHFRRRVFMLPVSKNEVMFYRTFFYGTPESLFTNLLLKYNRIDQCLNMKSLWGRVWEKHI